MEEPLVSIIIPAYNHERFVEDCIKGILAQTYKNIEVIFTDDNSIDNTLKIIKSYLFELEKRFEYVKVIENESNKGVTLNINNAVKDAHGKYIKIIASDDVLVEDAIENLVSYYQKHEDYLFIHSNAIYISEDDHHPIIPKLKKRRFETSQLYGYDLGKDVFLNNICIHAPGAMIKKKTYEMLGLHDEDIGVEDFEFFLRCATNGGFGYCDIITNYYRVSNTSMSHYSKDKYGEKRFLFIIENTLKIYDKYQDEYLDVYKKKISRVINDYYKQCIKYDYYEAKKYVDDIISERNIRLELKSIIYRFLFVSHLNKWIFK